MLTVPFQLPHYKCRSVPPVPIFHSPPKESQRKFPTASSFGSPSISEFARGFNSIQREMRKSGFVAASMAAVSATAYSASSSSSSKSGIPHKDVAVSVKKKENSSSQASSSSDKFAPRFDGLRFIETLVTAHR